VYFVWPYFIHAKKGAKITQTRIRETSYYSIKLHLKQVFRSVCRHELETRLSHKPWKQEITKVPGWPRRKTVAEFWLCVGHDCLGTHLHCIEIHPDPHGMLCSLHEPMHKNHLGQCTIFIFILSLLYYTKQFLLSYFIICIILNNHVIVVQTSVDVTP